jgi:hypothetical protein
LRMAVLGVNGKYPSSISIHWSPWPNLYRKIECRMCWPMHYLIDDTYDCRKSFVKSGFCGYRQRATGTRGRAAGGPVERAAVGGQSAALAMASPTMREKRAGFSSFPPSATTARSNNIWL